MRKGTKVIGVLIPFLIFVAGVIYWFEAEKEVRILCSIFEEGQPSEGVISTLETGNLLMYSSGPKMIYVDSFYTLATSSCTVTLSDDSKVIEAVYEQTFRLEKAAGWIGVILTFLLFCFQCLLAAGLPLGEYAWGGFHKELPKSLRIGSLVSTFILIFAALALLSASKILQLLPEALSAYTVIAFMVLFALSIVGNLNSNSQKEKRIMTPVATTLFCCYFIVSINALG